MTYTAEIKDEQGNVVSTFPVSPAGGDKLNTIILDSNLNLRQSFSLNSMKEVRDFEYFWKDERDVSKLRKILDGKKGFTDVDACSEINGYIVNIEFKNGIADIQASGAFAQLVKAVREAIHNNTFTYFAISNGDLEDIKLIIPIFPATIDKVRNASPKDLQWLVQKSNKKTLRKSIRMIEDWTLEEDNLRKDDAFEIAKKIQNAVHIYNMNN